LFENLKRRRASRQNLSSNFVDLLLLADLPQLILQPSVASTKAFYNFRTSLLSPSHNDVITKNFSAFYAKEKSGGNPLGIHFLEIILPTFFGGNPLVDGIF
jgi:hypothetical protein